jgi:hypothetical protein
MVALLQRRDAGADIDDHARALMAEDGRENALGIGAGPGEFVGVADAGGLDLDQNFAARGPSSTPIREAASSRVRLARSRARVILPPSVSPSS